MLPVVKTGLEARTERYTQRNAGRSRGASDSRTWDRMGAVLEAHQAFGYGILG